MLTCTLPVRGAAVIAILLAALGCSQETTAPPAPDGGADPVCTGTTLFGRPMAKTGLSDTQCQPRCTCEGNAWEAPDYGAADIDALAKWNLTEPFPEVTSDPYAGPAPGLDGGADAVCAVLPAAPGSHDYTLRSYASPEEAMKQGAIVTHFGACGVCSPLVDLGVYMRYPDLTAPVRDCGLQNFGGTEDAHVSCLRDLGFDLPCAQIWYYNTLHTATDCSSICFGALDATYNTPDGGLDPCLQCDEDKSGPVFKAVAGRTRRNTGIASAICRPCGEVRPLVHAYP